MNADLWPFLGLGFRLPAAEFDWLAELAAPTAPSSVGSRKTTTTPSVVIEPTAASPPPARSFAQVLAASQSRSVNENLPQPIIRGDEVSIKISPEIYEKGLAVCKRNLGGRLVLNKGDKPYTTKEIQQKLEKQWKTTASWTMLSLGRGYYEFFFTSELDLRTVWSSGTVNLKPGVLRLFEWAKEFNANK